MSLVIPNPDFITIKLISLSLTCLSSLASSFKSRILSQSLLIKHQTQQQPGLNKDVGLLNCSLQLPLLDSYSVVSPDPGIVSRLNVLCLPLDCSSLSNQSCLFLSTSGDKQGMKMSSSVLFHWESSRCCLKTSRCFLLSLLSYDESWLDYDVILSSLYHLMQLASCQLFHSNFYHKVLWAVLLIFDLAGFFSESIIIKSYVRFQSYKAIGFLSRKDILFVADIKEKISAAGEKYLLATSLTWSGWMQSTSGSGRKRLPGDSIQPSLCVSWFGEKRVKKSSEANMSHTN